MKKAAVAGIVVIVILAYAFLQKQESTSTLPSAPNQTGNRENGNSTNPNDSSSQTQSTPSASASTTLKDGTYTGDQVNVFYGDLQVQATVTGGKITDIQFPVYPNDSGHTQEISNIALPQLKQEALQAQSANVDVISGATQTSQGFVQSLSSALAKAQ